MLSEMMRSAFVSSIVVEAEDASSALRLCRDIHFELVLLDVALPDGNGVALTAEIKLLNPVPKVVIVSNNRARTCQDAAADAGAEAYVFKDEVYEKLLPVLALVLDR